MVAGARAGQILAATGALGEVALRWEAALTPAHFEALVEAAACDLALAAVAQWAWKAADPVGFAGVLPAGAAHHAGGDEGGAPVEDAAAVRPVESDRDEAAARHARAVRPIRCPTRAQSSTVRCSETFIRIRHRVDVSTRWWASRRREMVRDLVIQRIGRPC